MLSAIDLRIGNWVNTPNEGLTQLSNGKEIDDAITNGAQAIRITEELLFSMGFVKRGESEIYDIKENNFAYHLGVRKITIYHPENHYWHWLSSHIDNVHQLQNIFYCIVGYDLSLNGTTNGTKKITNYFASNSSKLV